LRCLKKIDFAINAAGIIGANAPIVNYTESNFDDIISVNVKGTFFSVKLEAAQFLKQDSEGVIINYGSIASEMNLPGMSVYSLSKAALHNITVTAAKELAPKVRVNTLNLGPFETDMFVEATGGTEEGRQSFVSNTLVKRIGDPDDAAALTLFLCSDQAKFITGVSYKITGGLGI